MTTEIVLFKLSVQTYIYECAYLQMFCCSRVLFINHVKYVSNVISNISPNTTVLIWDDMLRKIRFHEWKKIEVFNNVETVHWNYDEWKKIPHINFMSYRKMFKNNWVASAFKGADGFTAVIPNIHKRLMNHYSMLRLLQTSKIPGILFIFITN